MLIVVLAASWVHLFASVGNGGGVMYCGTISWWQLAATSKMVRCCWSQVTTYVSRSPVTFTLRLLGKISL